MYEVMFKFFNLTKTNNTGILGYDYTGLNKGTNYLTEMFYSLLLCFEFQETDCDRFPGKNCLFVPANWER